MRTDDRRLRRVEARNRANREQMDNAFRMFAAERDRLESRLGQVEQNTARLDRLEQQIATILAALPRIKDQ